MDDAVKTRTWLLVATALALWTVPMGAGEMTFVTYANARFHYVIEVPAHFVKAEAPTNDDGRTFRARLDELQASPHASRQDVRVVPRRDAQLVQRGERE